MSQEPRCGGRTLEFMLTPAQAWLPQRRSMDASPCRRCRAHSQLLAPAQLARPTFQRLALCCSRSTLTLAVAEATRGSVLLVWRQADHLFCAEAVRMAIRVPFCDGCGRTVRVLQVQADAAVVPVAEALRAVADSDSETMEGFCGQKVAASPMGLVTEARQANLSGEFERLLWHYLQATFAPEPRKQFLALLGAKSPDARSKLIAVGLDAQLIQQDSLEVVQSFGEQHV